MLNEQDRRKGAKNAKSSVLLENFSAIFACLRRNGVSGVLAEMHTVFRGAVMLIGGLMQERDIRMLAVGHLADLPELSSR